MTDITSVVVLNEDIIETAKRSFKLGEKEYYHQDFPLLVNCYLQNTTKKPILLKGEFESGKKTMAKQLGKIIGQEPKIFDFSHSTVNDEAYFDQNLLIEKLRQSEQAGEFIVIKDFDQLDTYDSFLLMTYFQGIKDNKNPRSIILILENNIRQYFRNLTDVVRRSSATITIGKDPVIEAKIQKAKEEKEKAKQKKMKGVM